MYGKKLTLYDVLEVSRDAKQTEIVRAYRILSGHFKKETAAPDPKREALLHQAYEILSDPDRRDAYDRSLRKPSFLGVTTERDRPAKWIAAAAALVGLAFAVYFAFRTERDVASEPLPQGQVASSASLATGRLVSIDISGKSTPIGLAFAIAPGVMATSCHGLKPGAQLVVQIPPRSLPARVEAGGVPPAFCTLGVEGAGSWPLKLRGFGPNGNEKLYATSINAAGDLLLKEVVARRVMAEDGMSVIETSHPVGHGMEGGPLLDSLGRVVGMAVPSRHVGLPRVWIDDVPEKRAPAAASKREAVVDAPVPAPAPTAAGTPAEGMAGRYDSVKSARDAAIDRAAAGK
jgi:hypothetical protein